MLMLNQIGGHAGKLHQCLENANRQQTLEPLGLPRKIPMKSTHISSNALFGQTSGKRELIKNQGRYFYSPHTKPSGLTVKMLLPFSSWGWAQLAFMKLWKLFSTTHGGSHFSWQSHRRLDVFKCLRRGITFSLFGMKCRFLQVSQT